MIYNNMLELVGNTPILKASNFARKNNLGINLFLKLESYNPAGSVKDRIALAMVEDLEKRKIINKQTTLIEATSGNTGIGLAFVCAIKGYNLIITMPETMSKERKKLLTAYGAKVVLTDGNLGMKGAIKKSEELNKSIENSVILGQFKNFANPKKHYETTGVEIWKALNKKVDVLVVGVGTGGTLTGGGEFLKEQNKKLVIVAIEPEASAVLSGELPSSHKIQGIGAGFVPKVLRKDLINHIIKIGDKEAFEMSNALAKLEGVLAGISSGAVLAGVVKFFKNNIQYKNKNVVCVLADSGERYLSTELYE